MINGWVKYVHKVVYPLFLTQNTSCWQKNANAQFVLSISRRHIWNSR